MALDASSCCNSSNTADMCSSAVCNHRTQYNKQCNHVLLSSTGAVTPSCMLWYLKPVQLDVPTYNMVHPLTWCIMTCLFHRDKLRALRARQRLLSDYFDMGSSYGKPSPLLLQPLAEELAGRADLSVLWCVRNVASMLFMQQQQQQWSLLQWMTGVLADGFISRDSAGQCK